LLDEPPDMTPSFPRTGVSGHAGAVHIAGTPATTMPITTTATGLPIGIQAMGPAGGDRTTVEFAALLTEVLGGFRVPPL
ncbi:amidase family protein, partial [Mycobacterium tuberculosis]